MQPQLRQRALDLVRNRPANLSLKVIAKEAGVNHAWLKSFVLDCREGSGVDNVERVYTYLSGRQLELK